MMNTMMVMPMLASFGNKTHKKIKIEGGHGKNGG
jgi:hypothetical protein